MKLLLKNIDPFLATSLSAFVSFYHSSTANYSALFYRINLKIEKSKNRAEVAVAFTPDCVERI